MYKSIKKEDGTYSRLAFMRRGLQLVSLRYFLERLDLYVPNANVFCKLKLVVDFYLSVVRYGVIVNDYFEYRFWEKKHILRKEYVTMRMNIRIKRLFNHEPEGIFRNKTLFNRLFAEQRNLLFFSFSSENNEEDFCSFVKQCDGNIIAKPLTGYSGLGIYKPDVSSEELVKKTYRELKEKGEYFCEEVFFQNGILKKVYPLACNTLRIYTLHDGEKAHIMATMIRFGGNGASVDNIHAGGMVCPIDKETGIIIGLGYNLRGETFVKHPYSGVVLPGIQIPNWEKVLSMVLTAAEKYPQQGHIGWDIAVSDNKCCIIEGNDGGNFDIIQVPFQKGVKREYESIIKLRFGHI